MYCLLFVFYVLIQNTHGSDLEFPSDFKFGVSTAAFQIEGGWNADGKGENIWDHLLHIQPNFTKDHKNGDVACNSYELWQEDVKIIKKVGVNFYRFSISWSRILPTGNINYINPYAIKYYNNLINELIKNNIEPVVTTYHADLPQPLQDLGGWTNYLTVKYYEQYANVLFKEFGDRVKKWITFNEPVQICGYGYGYGAEAPAIHLSGIADYICGKNILLSHARAYRLYEKAYKEIQKGEVGITINSIWAEPKTNQMKDIEAAERCLQMEFGWWANPIFSQLGDYPQIMKDRINNISLAENYPQSRLPSLTQDEVLFIKGTADFFGLNHYSTYLVSDNEYPINSKTSRDKDTGVKLEQDPKWPASTLNWLKTVPWGFRKLLNWIKKTYNNPLVYITENGYVDAGTLKDYKRIEYHKEYLEALLQAIHLDNCNVKAYSIWSIMDNLEWAEGYTAKFGLYSVNFTDPMKMRTAKLSSHYYNQVIKTRRTAALFPIVELH